MSTNADGYVKVKIPDEPTYFGTGILIESIRNWIYTDYPGECRVIETAGEGEYDMSISLDSSADHGSVDIEVFENDDLAPAFVKTVSW